MQEFKKNIIFNTNKLLNFIFLAICIMISDLSASEHPLIMFTSSWNSLAVKIAVNNFEHEDLLGSNLDIGKTKTFTLPPDLQKVKKQSRRKKPPTVIIYDPEHWIHTPPKERDNILQSIKKSEKIVHSQSSLYGLAPDGQYIGLMPKACKAVPSYLLDDLNWNHIDYFVIQSQRLLSKHCGGEKNIKRYIYFVKKWSEGIKKNNPNCKIFASMSFKFSDVSTMKEAIKNTHKFIDGYYLAYPNPKKSKHCKHCIPLNLLSIIKYIKIYKHD